MGIWHLLLPLVLLLSACATAPRDVGPEPGPAALPAEAWPALAPQYRALAAAAPAARLLRFDPAQSRLQVLVFRAGRAARLGHNHLLGVPQFEAWALWDAQAPAQSRFELRLALASLSLDEAAERAALGGAFAAPLSPAAIAATRINLLGPQGLDAARHPQLRLRLLQIEGEPPWLIARLAVEGLARSGTLELPLKVSVQADGGMRFEGSALLRQSALGITPLSLGAGLLAVQDTVLLDFSLLAR